jgi:hypothetical protein|mmetsp:Transcript_50832/g.80561  ORF Transcript_50832/g.80561 Transcript_50832/m.80561 type:complete len:632 (+) Transcript_50832:188-2083(+)
MLAPVLLSLVVGVNPLSAAHVKLTQKSLHLNFTSSSISDVEKPVKSTPWTKSVLDGLENLSHRWTHQAAMPVTFGLGMVLVFLCAIVDCRAGRRADPEKDDPPPPVPTSQTGQVEISQTGDSENGEPPERSFTVILLITSYRFYTGFLGATWVPFLIAKEGKSLFRTETALISAASFMGIEKMVYGFSFFLNPFFGLLSDKLAATAPWGGRSAFLLGGIGIAGIGIYGAKLASENRDVNGYVAASCLWMLGEAMADITTETVAPETVPPSQYDLAGAVKSTHHLVGALVGYIVLVVAAAVDLNWRWLYVIYLGLMMLFALPTVACMRSLQDNTWRPRQAGRAHTGPVCASIFEAYIAPMRYAGGFPRACLCMCVFSLGSGPMFFTLLMLHDLVGLKSSRQQQTHFSCISIAFLVGACIMAACSGVSSDPQPRQSRQSIRAPRQRDAESDSSDQEATNRPSVTAGGGDAGAGPSQASSSEYRWTLMFWSCMSFGFVCVIIPGVSLPSSTRDRLICFYVVSFFLGMGFGAVYSRFQACVWSLLPPQAEIANAMGFAALSKLAGAGFGNFIAGLILDSFRGGYDTFHGQNYNSMGYFVMCWASALCVFISSALVFTIGRQSRVISIGQRLFCMC